MGWICSNHVDKLQGKIYHVLIYIKIQLALDFFTKQEAIQANQVNGLNVTAVDNSGKIIPKYLRK